MEHMNADNIFWNIYLIVEDIKDAKAALKKVLQSFNTSKIIVRFYLLN